MDRIQKLTAGLSADEAYIITGKANIFYYSRFTSEDALLYISKNNLTLLTDSRYTVQAKEQAKEFDIITDSDFLKKVPEKSIGFEEEYMTCARLSRLKEIAKDKTFIPAQEKISKPRRIKSDAEISKIAAAEALGCEAFSYITDFIRPGISEKEIALELEFYMRKKGAEGLSFETIVASGVRGAMPHGTASEKIIKSGEMVTIDFGCILDGYCSDMTRTVSVGTPDSRMKEIYDVVQTAQTAAIAGIRAGVKCSDADKIARDIIKDAGYGENFGHSLGHSVGIEIHEAPNLSPKSKDTLESGNVVTVEPGIYVENLGGVRIEDVVAVTADGIVNLTCKGI